MVERVEAAVVQHDLAQPPDAALDFRAAVEKYDYSSASLSESGQHIRTAVHDQGKTCTQVDLCRI
jgi:hypothetical protein